MVRVRGAESRGLWTLVARAAGAGIGDVQPRAVSGLQSFDCLIFLKL